MANRDTNTNKPASAMSALPLHQPFSWLAAGLERDRQANFAALVIDVTRGAKVVIDMLRRDAMEISNGTRPNFTANDSDALTGLMAASMQMLFEQADEQVERFNDAALKGEQA